MDDTGNKKIVLWGDVINDESLFRLRRRLGGTTIGWELGKKSLQPDVNENTSNGYQYQDHIKPESK